MSPARARVNGVELSWEEAGAADAAPFVLIHGFTGHRDDFREVRAALAGERRVITPDLRGHGDSDWPVQKGGVGLDELAGDLCGLLDHLAIPRCDLLGHSMGGMVALRFVLAHPERVRRLVLMSTAPCCPETLGGEGFERAIAIALEEGMASLQSRAERAGRRREDPVIARWAERYWSHHRRRYLAMAPRAYAELGRAMVAQAPVVDRLGEIACPTLVLVGAHDAQFLPGAKLLAQHLPNAHRLTLPDAGHHPHQESPDAWLAAVRDHLG